eukprot:CAMPEP_0202956172 /NCGR_PEP_ID=MMETSP1396-20130829/716_1 /ASSEMBLY_ACC=CAM_ASM_000872 /TAXON_ID= /ORGANISM="Pseudokeronopsis sp., Strain Brazil" /LENGTH=115 /DNA_ID=CAMNT_0049673079 /DNA_START=954 /DNA_END=1301 /DNA_ORIENTATION=-
MNLAPEANHSIWKLKSQDSCCNIVGQLGTLLMVDPPKRGVESDETVDLFEKESKANLDSLNYRAKLMHERFNKMEGFSCAYYEGGANAFPRMHLPEKAIQKAKEMNMTPDHFFCD